MTARHSHIVLVLAAFMTGLVVFLGVFLYASGQFGRGSALGPSAIGGPFNLVDQDGKPITNKDFLGKPLIVFFGYTHCPDICPTTLFELSQVLHAMGKDADRVNALFITVDPERDTPAVMKDYLSSFDKHLLGATGSQQQIDAAEKEYRVYAKKVPEKNGDYSMDHSAVVYLMNKQGRFVAPFNLKRKPAEAAAALDKYL
jgi:protein SCO1